MCISSAAARLRSGFDDNAPATSSNRSSIRAAIRCTAPMNAPGPPPTIPSRSLRFVPSTFTFAVMSLAPSKSNKPLEVSLTYCPLRHTSPQNLLFLSTFNFQPLPQRTFGLFEDAIPAPTSAGSPFDPPPNSQNHQTSCSPPE